MRVEDAGRGILILLSGLTAALSAAAALIGLLAGWGSAAEVILFEVCFISAAALFGGIAIRRHRAGLRISPRKVCLRGFLRTHRLAPEEVERFVPAPFRSLPLMPPEAGVRIVRRGGEDLDVWAMAGAAQGFGTTEDELTAIQPLCDELNQLLGKVRPRSRGPRE